MNIALWIAVSLIVGVSIAHSWLGERYILLRLFRRNDLPELFGSAEFTRNTLRFAWHVTSVAWLGLGALLVALTGPPITTGTVGLVVGGTFLVHFFIALFGSRGRHYSWLVFLAIGLLTLYSTRG